MEPVPILDVLAQLTPLLDPELRRRCQVIRTVKTEERQPIPYGLRVEVLKRDNFRCVWCGSDARLELDHIDPWSAGGADTFDNLRTLCHGCNSYRSNYTSPVDSTRRLPSGFACVTCRYDEIAGDPDLTAIWCRSCGHAAAGLAGIAAYREIAWRDVG